jgi:glycosyltransferase involved in cell wall biosynthesis
MKISIVTACYNSASTIKDTLKSIQMQTHPDIEHIVIDGGSTDGTLDILEQNKEHITYLSSEPDNGLYDAMNKGIMKATGDVIGLLNSDDLFADAHALSHVARALSDDTVDACYGDLVYVHHDNIDDIARYWKSSTYDANSFAKGWIPAHPTFYVRKRIHDQHGMLFNLNYKLAADYEVLLRLLFTHRIKTDYIPEVMVKMRLGGATNKSLKNILRQNKEIMQALKQHQYPFSPIQLIGNKLADRVQQYRQLNAYAQ